VEYNNIRNVSQPTTLGIIATGPTGGQITFDQSQAVASLAPYYLLNMTVKLDPPGATATRPVTLEFTPLSGFDMLSGEQVQTYVQRSQDPPTASQFVYNFHALVRPTATTGTVRLVLRQDAGTLLNLNQFSVTINQSLI
jgi:hypothetical protein